MVARELPIVRQPEYRGASTSPVPPKLTYTPDAIEIDGAWWPVVNDDIVTSGEYYDPSLGSITVMTPHLQVPKTGFRTEATALFIAKLEVERQKAAAAIMLSERIARQAADRCLTYSSRAAGRTASAFSKYTTGLLNRYDLDGQIRDQIIAQFYS